MKKIAVVTGASSGMGRDFVFAVDREFRPEEISVIARREKRLLELQSQVRARIVPFAIDLSDTASFSRYEAALKEENPQDRKYWSTPRGTANSARSATWNCPNSSASWT